MAYNDRPEKKIEIREGRKEYSKDDCIKNALEAGNYGVRTDAGSQGVGYLGMDDLNRMRRRDWVRT